MNKRINQRRYLFPFYKQLTKQSMFCNSIDFPTEIGFPKGIYSVSLRRFKSEHPDLNLLCRQKPTYEYIIDNPN